MSEDPQNNHGDIFRNSGGGGSWTGCTEPPNSPRSIPKAPFDLLIPVSYNLFPKGTQCNAFKGSNNTNCATLISTHPMLNSTPKATPLENCAQVLLGRSEIGRAYKGVKFEGRGGVGEGLSMMTVIAARVCDPS